MKTFTFLFIAFIFSLVIKANAQWVQMSNGMGNIVVMSLAASGNNIFAGTLYGVYLSTDNGTNWTQTSLEQWPYAFAINGVNIFAGTANFLGVYLSTNNGTNWVQTSLNNRNIYSLAIKENNVFAGTYDYSNPYGVYMSTNNGADWVQTSLNNRNVSSLAVNENSIFAGTSSNYGVYLSTNNGTNWTQTSLNNRNVNSLAVKENNIFAGTTTFGVYLSTDNGTNWTQTSLNNQSVMSLAVNGNNVYAGTSANGVYVSNDNGTNWTQRNEGMGNLYIRSLCILNNYLFAGTQTAGVYRRPLGELTGSQTISNEVPEHFSLSQNYPNPFNPSTKIRFELPKSDFFTMKIFDALGREVTTLVNEQLKPGTYETEFNGTVHPSGVYFYTMTVGNFVETKKMIMLK